MQNVLTFQISGRNHFTSNEATTELSSHQTQGLCPLLEETLGSKEASCDISARREDPGPRGANTEQGPGPGRAFLFGWFIYFASSANLKFV